jgi:hypothetical protein
MRNGEYSMKPSPFIATILCIVFSCNNILWGMQNDEHPAKKRRIDQTQQEQTFQQELDTQLFEAIGQENTELVKKHLELGSVDFSNATIKLPPQKKEMTRNYEQIYQI